LRYANEVRAAEAYFDDVPDKKVSKDTLELARHIIEQKADHFKPEKFEDRYENAVVELLQKKQAGKKIERREEPRPSNVINLMDALRKSIAAERGGKAPARGKPERGRERQAPKRTGSRSARPKAKARKAG
jgi:DNA end-binding protein Ku